MENVRYRASVTSRKSKDSGYETTAGRLLAPSAGDRENYHHAGRRQWSRRRDVYAAPDDAVRVTTRSPPVIADAVRRRVDTSDHQTKSPPYWAQPVSAAVDGAATTMARSRSRPRPAAFLYERGVQISVDTGRFDEQPTRDDNQQRQGGRPRQQHNATVFSPTVEYTTRGAVGCRQVNPTSTYRTVTSPTPAAPLSPSYLNDNKTLLKEALMSAAAAKLARSTSARSAVVRPLVVIRNGPAKSSSDERIDADDDVTVTTTTIKSPVSGDASDVAMATAAAAAAAATRRSRTRRRDVDEIADSGAAVSETGVQGDRAGRRTRPMNRGAPTQTSVAVSSVSGTGVQEGAASRGIRPITNCNTSTCAAVQTSSSCNRNHMDDSRRPAPHQSTPGTASAAETPGVTTETNCAPVDDGKDPGPPASDTSRTQRQQHVDMTVNNDGVNRDATSVVGDVEVKHESTNSTSKVSLIKTILSRTRSPSPSRGRRSRSRALHTSPSPSSVIRLGAEVAQRIGEPFKGYLKQLRDRSSQRRRPAEPTAATKKPCEPESPACQDDELARNVDSQPRSGDAGPTSDDRSTDNISSRGRRFRTDRKKMDSLTSQWKSTSELTTSPVSRLDSLLKANSMQHLQTSTAAVSSFQTTRTTSVDGTTGSRAVSSSEMSSSPALTSKTSRSAGCLLASSDTQSGRQTTMTRCYLEKPPRAARRAVTIQLDRRAVDRQTSSTDDTGRQSTSQADLRHPQPAARPSSPGDKSTANNCVTDWITSGTTSEATSSTSGRLHPADDNDDEQSSQNERDLRELCEQKRLERQLEEKLVLREKERADVIAKLWSQIDTTRPRTAAVSDNLRNISAFSGLVLPLPYNTTSPPDRHNQVNTGHESRRSALLMKPCSALIPIHETHVLRVH